MQKLALVLAAGLLVSAPLIAAMPTESYAAAKKAAKKKEPTLEEVNSRFFVALGDLGKSLGTYVYVYKPAGDKKGK